MKSPPPCPPLPNIERYLAKEGNTGAGLRQRVLSAEADIENWQADKTASELKDPVLWRRADVAICEARQGLEVIRIRVDRAHRLPSGKWIEAHERYPQSERWGTDGFSYTPNSHSDPWAAAFARTIILLEKHDL